MNRLPWWRPHRWRSAGGITSPQCIQYGSPVGRSLEALPGVPHGHLVWGAVLVLPLPFHYWVVVLTLVGPPPKRCLGVPRVDGCSSYSLNQPTGDSYTRHRRHVDTTRSHVPPSVPMSCGSI